MSGVPIDATNQSENTEQDIRRPVIILSGGNSVKPLAKGLSEAYDIGILYPQIAEPLKEEKLPVFGIDEGGSQVDQGFGVNWAATNIPKIIGNLNSKRGMRSLLPETEIFGSLSEDLKSWFPGFAMSGLSRIVARLNVWTRLWETRDIKLVVTHEDVCEDTRALTQFAKARGTPTLNVPHFNHGTIIGNPPDLHNRVICDWIAVAGEYMKEWYMDRGVDEGRIRVTGHPQWDRFTTMQRDRRWACAMLKLDHKRPVVTYASDWVLWTTLLYNPKQPELGWQTMLSAMHELRNDGVQLVCKVHPNSRNATAEWHAAVARDLGVNCLVTAQHGDIVLQATDLMVSNGFSNYTTEATMLGSPAIWMGEGFVADPLIPSVPYDAESLYNAIKLSFAQKAVWERDARPRILERYVGPHDGQATQRVVDWCKELICA